jgi:hypothetical protein
MPAIRGPMTTPIILEVLKSPKISPRLDVHGAIRNDCSCRRISDAHARYECRKQKRYLKKTLSLGQKRKRDRASKTACEYKQLSPSPVSLFAEVDIGDGNGPAIDQVDESYISIVDRPILEE